MSLDEKKNHYYDFTSLYPFVNKVKRHSTGHADVIPEDFTTLTAWFGQQGMELR